MAELLRVKGELMLLQGAPGATAAADDHFGKRSTGRADTPVRVGAPELDQHARLSWCLAEGQRRQQTLPESERTLPVLDAIRKALANNLCRCGTHARIVRAVMRAAEAM